MSKIRLTRRSVLRGAGGIAIALPWLEAMEGRRTAHAGPALAKRFLAVYTPGGTVRDRWRPSGTETSFTLSPILEPLEPIKNKLLVMDGLSMYSAEGEQHQAGIVAWLTGTGQAGDGYAGGPSIDQIIAATASAGKPRTSIEMAVRWGTGKSHGLLHPINSANFENNAEFNPIPPRLDPQQIFTDLFGTLDPNNSDEAKARIERKKSILDYVDRRYASLSERLGSSDRQKLEQHLTKIRELEQSLENGVVPSATCQSPTPVDTSDYDPTTGLNSSDDGGIVNTTTDAAIPKVGQFMMDMMVMAFACDITGAGTLQWTDTEAKHTFPWLSLNQHHHFYQHDGGFRPEECEQICRWYSEQHAYLLQALDAVDLGDHTLLDESVVFFGSELADPPSHSKDDMPFLLGGGGGGLRGGRFLRNENLADRSHNNLLSAMVNLFGIDTQTVGNPNFSGSPLTSLT